MIKKLNLEFLCVLCVLCSFNWTLHAEDTITLTDGKVVKGEISQEDADNIFIKLADGEGRAIAKSRIARIERVQVKKVPAQAQGPNRRISSLCGIGLDFTYCAEMTWRARQSW